MTVPGAAARELVDLAVRAPDTALRLAAQLRAGARGRADDADRLSVRTAAWHATARARVERGEPRLGLRAACRALAAADRQRAVAGDEAAAAARDTIVELRLLLAWIEHDRGNLDQSRRHLDLLPARLPGRLAARARCVTGLNLCVRGEHRAALAELSAAVHGSRRHDDRHWLANALVGRAVVRTYLGRLPAADADLAAAHELFDRLGAAERAATCLHNRGFVALRSGDVPRALRLFDLAVGAGLRVSERAEALVDRAHALLAAGLVDDAGRALTEASGLLDGTGRGLRFADACLSLGQCAARAGRYDLALRSATEAARLLRAQGRSAWLAVAEALRLRSLLADQTRADRAELAGLADAVGRAAARCERHGWLVEAAELRLAAARVAAAGPARRLLRTVQHHRRRGPAVLRVAGWVARARLAGLAGNRTGVYAACRAGLRVVDGATAGAPLAVGRAGLAEELAGELAGMGLAAAVRSGDPRTVLRWSERYRGVAQRVTRVRPPRDPALSAGLIELRAAEAGPADAAGLRRLADAERRVRELSLAAAVEPPPPAESPTPPPARPSAQAPAEPSAQPEGLSSAQALVRPSVRAPAEPPARPSGPAEPCWPDVVRWLGGAALLSFAAHDDQMSVIAVVDGRTRWWPLGPAGPVRAGVTAVRLAVGSRARTGHGLSASARRAAIRLDRLLCDPVRRLVGDRPLVIVPCAPLSGLPWGELPTCAGRPVSVAPSVTAWLAATAGTANRRYQTGSARQAGSVWVAGPRLRHADREVRALHERWGGRLLDGAAATVAATTAALDGAELAHVAAHCRFRADSAMFSGLELADGPLYGYDLDALDRPPRRLVLAACEGALGAQRPRDELVGLASVLLRRGTEALVASTVAVPDQAAVGLVTSLHEHLHAGCGLAEALANAQTEHGDHLGFVCLGSG